MKPTYIDVLLTQAKMAEMLYATWDFAAEGNFEYAMYTHFEYLLARDEYNEIAKHFDSIESNRLTDAKLIMDGLAEEFKI